MLTLRSRVRSIKLGISNCFCVYQILSFSLILVEIWAWNNTKIRSSQNFKLKRTRLHLVCGCLCTRILRITSYNLHLTFCLHIASIHILIWQRYLRAKFLFSNDIWEPNFCSVMPFWWPFSCLVSTFESPKIWQVRIFLFFIAIHRICHLRPLSQGSKWHLFSP